jgi:CheY-like chemotaxis protein
MKIIAADDNAVSLHVLRTTLKYWGHDVLAVPDGGQAWKALDSWGIPDMMVIDREMPRLSGDELLERIRVDTRTKDVYVVMLTARNLESDMKEGFDRGVDDYIGKPVREDELRESITKGTEFLTGKMGSTTRDELRRGNIVDFNRRRLLK